MGENSLGRDRAGLQSAPTSTKHSRVPLSPRENRAKLFLLTKECLSPTIIDPRQRGCPQAAAVVIEGIAVPIQGMVEVGIVPGRGTETFRQNEKGCKSKRKSCLKGTALFSISRERGLQQMGTICYVNSQEQGKAIKMGCKNCPGAGQVFTRGFSCCLLEPKWVLAGLAITVLSC